MSVYLSLFGASLLGGMETEVMEGLEAHISVDEATKFRRVLTSFCCRENLTRRELARHIFKTEGETEYEFVCRYVDADPENPESDRPPRREAHVHTDSGVGYPDW